MRSVCTLQDIDETRKRSHLNHSGLHVSARAGTCKGLVFCHVEKLSFSFSYMSQKIWLRNIPTWRKTRLLHVSARAGTCKECLPTYASLHVYTSLCPCIFFGSIIMSQKIWIRIITTWRKLGSYMSRSRAWWVQGMSWESFLAPQLILLQKLR